MHELVINVYEWALGTHADGSHGGTVLPPFVCVSVRLFPHDISKTDAARITSLYAEMFHHESWKSIYFGGQKVYEWGLWKVKVTSQKQKNIAGEGLCTPVSIGFF